MQRNQLVWVLLLSAILAACTSAGRYTDASVYYWADEKPEDGRLELWSCRDTDSKRETPAICMVDSEWPDGGLSR